MQQFFRRGDTGSAVEQVRATLRHLELLPPQAPGTVDELFDSATDAAVRTFQQQRGLSADGMVGPDTWRALEEARWSLGDRLLSYSVSRPLVGDDVSRLQERLVELGFDVGRADAVFGTDTEAALREFQRNYGLVADGTCGPATLRALRMLDRAVRGGRAQWMREDERLHRSGPTLAGKVVVLDPGHGGHDRGAMIGGVAEADVAAEITSRVEGRLIASGATVYLTHGPTRSVPDDERAAFANACDADLLLSVHCDAADSPRPTGVATYHFGTGTGATSTVGERLAGLVQREVVARTGLHDCRTHAKAWPLLRRTRMPAVRIEVGYLTNPQDRRRLADPTFRDSVAEGILVAVQRVYLPPDRDVTTGRLRVVSVA